MPDMNVHIAHLNLRVKGFPTRRGASDRSTEIRAEAGMALVMICDRSSPGNPGGWSVNGPVCDTANAIPVPRRAAKSCRRASASRSRHATRGTIHLGRSASWYQARWLVSRSRRRHDPTTEHVVIFRRSPGVVILSVPRAERTVRPGTSRRRGRRFYQKSDSSRMLHDRQKDNSDHADYRCGKRRGSVGRTRDLGAGGNSDDRRRRGQSPDGRRRARLERRRRPTDPRSGGPASATV